MEFIKGYYVTAEIHVKDENKIEKTKKELNILQEKTVEEKGCTLFKVHQSNTDESTFILWERYENEASFKIHFEYEHTKNYASQDLTEVVKFHQTDII